MSENALIFICLGIFIFLMIALLIWRLGPKKCPKCGNLAFVRSSMLNTSASDFVYRCSYCDHQWYVDRSEKII